MELELISHRKEGVFLKHRLIFTGKKLIRMVLLLLGVSLAAFLLMSASPLDPLQTLSLIHI